MGTLLGSLGPLIDSIGAMISTIAGALTSAGIYMAGPVTDLQAISGPQQILDGQMAAATAAGANAAVLGALTYAQGVTMAEVMNTDTVTVFFSGIASPFIAVTGQLMQDTSTILVTLPDVFTAVNTFLTTLATFLG